MAIIDGGIPPGRAASERGATPDQETNARSLSGTVAVTACPALGIFDDRSTRLLGISNDHRCYAAHLPRRIPLEHQTGFCLTDTYERCPLWNQSADRSFTFAPAANAAKRHKLRAPRFSRNNFRPSLPHLSLAALPLLRTMSNVHPRFSRPRLPRGHISIPLVRRPLPKVRLPRPRIALVQLKSLAPGLHLRPTGPILAQDPARVRHRRRFVLPAAVAGLLVLAVALGGGLIAFRANRSSSPQIVGSPVVAVTAVSQPAIAEATPFALATPAPLASAIADDRVLRPGAVLAQRLNVSLDGSDAGNTVVSSHATSTIGCDRPFLDIYAYDTVAGRFADVYDATAGGTDTPLLATASSEQGCFPRVGLLDSRTFEGINRPVLITTVLSATRTHVVAIGVPAQGPQGILSAKPRVMLDLFAGPDAVVRVLDSPARVEISEPAFAPDIAALTEPGMGSVGAFRQVLGGQAGRVAVIMHSLTPGCYSGTVVARLELNGERWLRIKCPAGSSTADAVFVLADGASISPAGAAFESIQTGDPITVVADGMVRSPADAHSAVAIASSVQLTGAGAARFVLSPTATTAVGPAPTAAASATTVPTVALPAPRPAVTNGAPAAPAPVVIAPRPAAPAPVAPQPAIVAPRPAAPAPAAVAPAPITEPAPLPVAPRPAPATVTAPVISTQPPTPPPAAGGLAPAPTAPTSAPPAGGLAPPTVTR